MPLTLSWNQSNEELLRRLRDQMYRDRANLSNQPYPIYKGETIPPMSVSTQNARNLRSMWDTKQAPYSNKINKVINRENKGFSDNQIQSLLNMLRRNGTSENLGVERLNKQFGNNFGYEQPREVNFRGKIGQDINRNLGNSENNIRDFNDQLGLIEGKRNARLAETFSQAGAIKKARREGHVNQLEEFGNQEHAFRNLKNKANQNAFNEEVNAPYRKLNNTEESLRGIDIDEMDPSRERVENQQLQKIINSYNQPYSPYPGKRVLEPHPQTQGGWELTNRISPKYRDQNYNERKRLEKGWLEGDNLATQTFNKIPEGVEPLMKNLDYLSREQLKKESKNIAGKHVRLGTYGSGAHKSETEKALREILNLSQGQREGIVLGTAKGKASLVGNEEENALKKYEQMAGLGGQEFMNILGGHKNLVNQGNKKWANEQEEENEKLRTWHNQINFETPMVKSQYNLGGSGQQTPLSTTTPVIPTTNLTELFKPTPHSEIVKNVIPQTQPIVNQQQNQEALKLEQQRLQQVEQQRLQQQQVEQQRLQQQQVEQQRLQQVEQQRLQRSQLRDTLRNNILQQAGTMNNSGLTKFNKGVSMNDKASRNLMQLMQNYKDNFGELPQDLNFERLVSNFKNK